ncbi:hypothetical protein VPH35_080340 [Triticum aestivum]|nr:F-box protein At5g07610-like isoform X2 [Triticum aestivum]
MSDAQEAAAAAAAQTLDEDDAAIALPTMSAMDRLPMELLAEILRRLPPRGIATCRAVRKGWRAAVDSNGLMLAVEHRVPHHVGGIIINFSYEDRPYFFPCGAGPTGIGLNATALDFMIPPEVETGRGIVLDHRNGLLLYEGEYALYVCNPATRRWAELPPLPSYRPGAYYLLFDPTESLHYSVFFFPEPNKHDQSMEWPPSSYMVKVYCSRSGQWDDMTFVREGGATTVAMWADRINERKRHAVYWRGAFYLHCPTGFIIRDGIRLHVIGDLSRLPTYLQKTAHDAEEETRSNSQIDLMLGISYGGRADILQACKKIAQKVYNKLLRPKDIDDSLFADELQTSWTDEFPYPDLLIRTSGELRLSDFMLWQSAYTELFFTDTLWPDFGEAEYLEALMSFQSRDRRFGKRKL